MARVVLHCLSIASSCSLAHAFVEAPLSLVQLSYSGQVAMTHKTVYAAQLEGYLRRASQVQTRFGPWWPVIDMIAKHVGYEEPQGSEVFLDDTPHADIVATTTEEKFNQAAYEKAVGTESMRAFATQVAEKEGLEIVQPSNFNAMLSWYDGTCQKQNYEALVAEMHLCALVGDICGGALAPEGSLLGKDVSAAGNVAKAALQKNLHRIQSKVKGNLRNPREVREEVMLVALMSRGAEKTLSLDGASLPKVQRKQAGRASSHSVLGSPSIGETAPLDEEGYAAVADAKDDEQMCSFVKRVMSDEDLVLTDEVGLIAFCPWYSGMRARQSYEALVAELVASVERPVTCGGGWLMRGSA